MTLPTLRGVSSGVESTATTSHSTNLPVTANAGDYVVVLFSVHDDATVSDFDGLTEIGNDIIWDRPPISGPPVGRTYLLYGRLSSSQTSLTFVTGSNDTSVTLIYHFDPNAELVGFDAVRGNDDSPDPMVPSLGLGDCYEFASCVWLENFSLSSYPSGYTTSQITDRISTGTDPYIGAAAGIKIVTGTEDPGVFTLSATARWLAVSWQVEYLAYAAPPTGTVAATEAADASSATGSAFANPTGTLAKTEVADSAAIVGVEIFAGTVAKAEETDSPSAIGTEAFFGSSAIAESSDNSSAIGSEVFSGSLVTTEVADAASATGTTFANSTGTSAAIEGADSSAAVGTETFVGSSAVSEVSDAASITGSTTANPTGSAATTEAADSSVAVGSEIFSGTAATTEATDIASAVGSEAFSGSAAITEVADAATGSGLETFTSTVAAVELADATTAVGYSSQEGSLNLSEGVDTTAASGTIAVSGAVGSGEATDAPSISGGTFANPTGSSATTEASDSSAAIGSELFSGSAAIAEATDAPSIAGSTFANPTGSASPTEASDNSTAIGSELFSGSIAAIEAIDSPSITGSTLANSTGTSAAIEAADSSAASGSSSQEGALNVAERVDTSASSGAIEIPGSGSLVEASDAASIAGSTFANSSGSVASTELIDSPTAIGAETFTGTVAATEGADASSTGGGTSVVGSGSPIESADAAVISGTESIGGAIASTEGTDSPTASGASTQEGTLNLTEGADNSGSSSGAVIIGGSSAITEGTDAQASSGSGYTPNSTGVVAITEGRDPIALEGSGGRPLSFPIFCCCGTCQIASDNFNRPDGDPGSKWSGDGVIVDNALEADNDTTTVCSPTPLGSFHASCKLVGTTNGAVYIIKPGDPNGAYLVTATFTGTVGSGTFNIKVETGVETLDYDFDWDFEDETLVVCYQPGVQLSAGPSGRAIVNSGEAQWVTLCINNNHDDCWPGGLGNWTFVSGTFDDWIYQVHWIERLDCPNCDCFCSEGGANSCIPDTLNITIFSSTCSGINGTYTMLQKVVLGTSLTDYPTTADWPQKRYWVSEEIACPHPAAGDNSLVFILECQTDGLNSEYPSFLLTARRFGDNAFQCSNIYFDPFDDSTVDPGTGEPQEITTAHAKPSSSCSPLSLNFPVLCESNFSCSEPSYACCGGSVVSGDPEGGGGGVSSPSCFTITITE
jgi:hypothetical protein